MLEPPILSVFLVSDFSFQGLVEAERKSGKDLSEGGQALISSPPWTWRRMGKLSSLEYYFFFLQSLSNIMGVLSAGCGITQALLVLCARAQIVR